MNDNVGAYADILRVAEGVAYEKNIDRDIVLQAMEQALSRAGRSRYGQEFDIRAHVDRKNGAIALYRYRSVVEQVENAAVEIRLDDRGVQEQGLSVGDVYRESLPPVSFGRGAASSARQVILQRVREAEQERQYNEFKDKVGEIINGIVKRLEFGNVIVDLGTAEALMRREELLGREVFRRGDRVRAYVMDVRPEARGAQIFLSRAHRQFVAGLFRQEVPEIYDGVIEIKSVAHEAGSRAKIAVHSHESTLDPVGACVGMRGSRVQAVVGELKGEKIDIVPWSPNLSTFVVNALSPVEVSKVRVDEEDHRVDVIVAESQLSLAIGRRGQNVRLASQLVGWDIDILTEEVESERRRKEFDEQSRKFMELLDVEDVIAHLLVTEGFSDVEEVAAATEDDLAAIEGFDSDVARELHSRAVTAFKKLQRKLNKELAVYGLAHDTISLSHDRWRVVLGILADKGLTTRDAFADLAGDEAYELLRKHGVGRTQADELVMAARAHWFETDKPVKKATKKVSKTPAKKVAKTTTKEKKTVGKKAVAKKAVVKKAVVKKAVAKKTAKASS
ncbi:MAG: transcription termination/antitermination protein NusA [Alphaproteobacteria bacterium GM202ARS2]|nr:transcription termination/antitermination protein NusA [Alphaproteobacteria bacterium GM202ARS2]